MSEFLILRLDAPLQSWGSVAMDPKRPTHEFPTRSALAGMIASAVGWRYRDGHRVTALQDALRYAVREERPPVKLRDYQTADLGRIGIEGWTRWGMERRGGGSAARGTQILEKYYLADGVFMVALAVEDPAPLDLDAVEAALCRPARPLFLGRKSCIPAAALAAGRQTASSPYEALAQWPVDPTDHGGPDAPRLRCWYEDGQGPDGTLKEVWDRRDYETDRFAGSRTVVLGWVEPPLGHGSGEATS